MAHRSSWPPVYPGLNKLSPHELHKASPVYTVSDTSTLISVASSTAILTYIAQHAIHSAAEYCRVHNLTFATQDRLFEYLRQRSVIVPPQTGVAPDVAGSGQGGGEQAAQPKGKRPEARRRVT